jgi:hypothetical protein
VATLHDETIVNDSAEYKELARIRSSPTFAKSPRLCSLLEFIVTRSVEGRHDELTEQQIGIHLFGRSPGYNSSEDTIVRGTARHLRQRLESYYSGDGAASSLRVDIPKGGYIAIFKKVGQTPRGEVQLAFPIQGFGSQQLVEQIRSPILLKVAVAVLSVAVTCLSVAYILQRRTLSSLPVLTGPQPLWHALFTQNRETLIVPGDESLDVFIAWEQRSVTLEQYATKTYDQHPTVTVPPTHKDVSLSTRSATPMADLALVSMLVRVPEYMGEPQLDQFVELRFARDLEMADMHRNNLILIGSETFDPWVMLYQPQMDFVAHWDFRKDVYTVVNNAPQPDELPLYEYNRRASPAQKAITHIALLSNSQGVGRVLVVEGTSMGSTYSAVNFLTDEELWRPVIKQATDKSGRLHDFEVLLSGDFHHGGVANTKVIAIHVH